MPRYAIVRSAIVGRTNWVLHKAGCQDLRRRANEYHLPAWEFEAESPAQAVALDLADLKQASSDGGWTEKDYQIMPCCEGE